MRNIWTIAAREFNLYFASPIAYVVMFIILVPVAMIFAFTILDYSSSFGFGGFGAPDSGVVTGPIAFLLVFTAPALTMRLIADEQRMGTLELLLTAPVRDAELVLGKWLGAFLFMLVIFAISLIFPIILDQFFVEPGIDQMLMLSQYLGVILISAAFLSMGLAFSAFFANQFAAYFASLTFIIIMWWMIGAFSGLLPTGGEIFSYLNMSERFYSSLLRGVINLSDIVYYVSVTAFGLVVSAVAVEMRRWRE
jgi:ABC-2 type transport system permease protein